MRTDDVIFIFSLKCYVLYILGQYSLRINAELVFKTGLSLFHANDNPTNYYEIDRVRIWFWLQNI